MFARCYACLLALLVAACASYKPTAVPTVTMNDADFAFNDAGYGLNADPFVEISRQKSYFNANFSEAGFLSVFVKVKNNGHEAISVRPYDIYLIFPDGSELAPVDSQVVAMSMEENGSITGSVLAFGIVGGLVATQAEEDAKKARIADYASKQFKDTTLAPGASASGFVFYRVTSRVPGQTKLQARLLEVSTSQRSILEAPLGDVTTMLTVQQEEPQEATKPPPSGYPSSFGHGP